MNLDIIDYLIGISIALVVAYYAFLRYKEEKKKEKINYIPMLLSYLEKFEEEKQEFKQKADKFKQKIQQSKENLEKLKKSINNYQWKELDIEKLQSLKGTEFETYFSGLLEIMGYKLVEPAIYKDKNIDFIINLKNKNVCIDFVDFSKIKQLTDRYINDLISGKEKYNCKSVWLITNGIVPDVIKQKLFSNDINVISFEEIPDIFPSIRLFDDYFDEKTVLHNYELLYKETYDEIIRRNEWIDQINQKLKKAKENQVNNN